MKKNKKIAGLMVYSFDDVFKNSCKKAEFRRGYNEELLRLNIAKQIMKLRGNKKMTQKNVADKTGMPQSVIARIESGERGVTIDTLGRIAYALGKEVQLV